MCWWPSVVIVTSAEVAPGVRGAEDVIRMWYAHANGAMNTYASMAEELSWQFHRGKRVRTPSAVSRRDGHINYGKPWGRMPNVKGEAQT